MSTQDVKILKEDLGGLRLALEIALSGYPLYSEPSLALIDRVLAVDRLRFDILRTFST